MLAVSLRHTPADRGMLTRGLHLACRQQPREFKTDVSVAVALVALTTLWIVLAVVDNGRSHVRRRSYWFALLIGAVRWPALPASGLSWHSLPKSPDPA